MAAGSSSILLQLRLRKVRPMHERTHGGTAIRLLLGGEGRGVIHLGRGPGIGSRSTGERAHSEERSKWPVWTASSVN